jgi:hypothetical protein
MTPKVLTLIFDAALLVSGVVAEVVTAAVSEGKVLARLVVVVLLTWRPVAPRPLPVTATVERPPAVPVTVGRLPTIPVAPLLLLLKPSDEIPEIGKPPVAHPLMNSTKEKKRKE